MEGVRAIGDHRRAVELDSSYDPFSSGDEGYLCADSSGDEGQLFADCLSLEGSLEGEDALFLDQINEGGNFDDVFSEELSQENLITENLFLPTGTYIETTKKTTIHTVSQDLSEENLITDSTIPMPVPSIPVPPPALPPALTETQQSLSLVSGPFSVENDNGRVLDPRRGRPVFTPMDELPEQASLTPEIQGISIPPVVAVTQESPVSEPIEEADIDPTGAPMFTTLDQMVERANLSPPELQDIFSDLHGITENMANLQIKPPRPAVFSRLEDELSKLPADRTAAYRRAVLECPGLVSDERKMAFLERENGDPALAAVRLALHWETRLEVFGPDRCFLPMTLEGAMRDEVVNMVRWPVHQLLPVKDTAGRQIWYFDISLRDFEHYSIEQERRAFWYLISEVAMEDPDVVKNGIIELANWKNVEKKHYRDPNHKEEKGKPFRPYAAWIIDTLERAMPIQVRALQFCHPNWFFYHLLPIFLYFSGKYTRTRLQLHRGTEAEILQSLKVFCLPKECVPTELGGEVVLDTVKFLAHRMSLESSRPDPRLVLDQKPISVPSGPSAKRIRSENTSLMERKEAAATTGRQNPPAKSGRPSGQKPPAKSGRPSGQNPPAKSGRPSDPRMTKAVEVRLANSKLPLRDALERGGFTFHLQDKTGEPIDADKITLTQRKNQLSRRIREAKKDQERLRRQQQGPLGAAPAYQHYFPGQLGGSS